MKIFPAETVENFEFSKLLRALTENCISPMGKLQCAEFTFDSNEDQIIERLNEVDDFKRILENKLSFPAQSYYPLDKELEQIDIPEYALALEEFIRIRQVLQVVERIYKFFKKRKHSFEALERIIQTAHYEASILKSIDRVIDENGIVKSSASPALAKIRKQLASKRTELDKAFRKVVASYRKKEMLTDSVESIRNGRRVLSVQAEFKRSITGILLDESDSGKTSFIEPQETVNINNEIFEIERQEKREIYKILKELTGQVRSHRDLLLGYQHILGRLDVSRAKALLALQMDAVIPQISSSPVIRLIEARHPILYSINRSQQKETVPLNLEMDANGRILVISGPNAGGKSVCLKTIGLFQMMLHAGMLVPCDPRSELYLFSRLFTDLGDAQSLEDELSTYSSRLKNVKHFLDHSDKDTLILIDEFGSGTDPSLGGAMAEAILAEIVQRKAFGVVTTHYGNLKVFAGQTAGVQNGAMAFDEQSLEPTYRLEQGHPGSSYTFVIAEKSGLSKNLIEKAKQLTGAGNIDFEEMLNKLQQEKQRLEEKNQDLINEDIRLKKMIRQFESLSTELESQKKRLQYELKMRKKEELNTMDSKVRELLKELQESKNVERAARAKQGQISKERKETDQSLVELSKELFHKKIDGSIEVGSHVKLLDGDRTGVVEEIRKKKAVVAFGNIKTQVKLDELILVEESKTPSTVKPVRHFVEAREEITSSLDLRGMRKDEALASLEQFIDQALVQNLNFIKVIHGRGTGVLREMVWKKLREYKDVKEIKYEDDRYGGDGATLIEF